jgi:hypothetical protein
MPTATNLYELIKLVRPKAALFTTFTFSVSHFDSYFIPLLRSVGCQDIGVLVDASKAARSVQEGNSRAAGRVYSIAPVVAPGGGVFHPKIAYLAGVEDDVVSIGSGNLTASGQALQLECFDAVTATAAPGVFAELSELLLELAGQVERSSIQAAHLMRATAARAGEKPRQRPKSRLKTELPEPRLVHTVGLTARQTIEAVFRARYERAESLTILSPFHSKDGGPALRMSTSLKAKRLSIGLDAQSLKAPFDEARFQPLKVPEYVLPRLSAKESHKRLHAKVFELKARPGDVLVVTGSVNATHQSLETSKNVEISLARWLRESPFDWQTVETQGFEATIDPDEFEPQAALFVDAWLTEQHCLEGLVTSRDELPEVIDVRIEREQVTVHEGHAELKGGRFAIRHVPVFDTSSAVQLTVSCVGMEATCWLNLREELKLSAQERERRAAISRVLQGNFSLFDVAQVIQILASQAGVVAGKSRGKTPEPQQAEELGEDFLFDSWLESGEKRAKASSEQRRHDKALTALNHWLNSQSDEAETDDEGIEEDEDESPPAKKKSSGGWNEDARDRRRQDLSTTEIHVLLDRLCEGIPKKLEEQPDRADAGLLAEVVASRVVDRTIRQPAFVEPCVSWLDQYTGFGYAAPARARVSQIAAAMAVYAVSRLDAIGSPVPLSSFKEAVERACGRSLSVEDLSALAKEGFERDLFSRLTMNERQRLVDTAARIVSAATVDDALIALLRTAAAKPPRGHSQVDQEAAQVAEAMRTRSRHPLTLSLLDAAGMARNACPLCNKSLDKDEVKTLRSKHYLVHQNLMCRGLVIFSANSSRLMAVLRELQHA